LPCVMNAANEVAVAWFLQGRIKFLEIAEIIRKTVESATFCVPQSVDEYLQIDREVREKLQNDYR